MQTLGTFLGIGKSLTMLVAFLYRTIASAYTSMLQLIDSYNGSELQSVISTLVDRVYVLVGIFMLFRIAISLLTYLIDPDKMDDSKVGGKQLVTHIVVSIILLISLNSIIFPTIHSLQSILLDKDGILYNIVKDLTIDKPANTGVIMNTGIEEINNKITPIVNAENNISLTCYYTAISAYKGTTTTISSSNQGKGISITFYTGTTSKDSGKNYIALNNANTQLSDNGLFYYWSSSAISSNNCWNDYNNSTLSLSTGLCPNNVRTIKVDNSSKDSIINNLKQGTCPGSISNIMCDSNGTQCYLQATMSGGLATIKDTDYAGNGLSYGRADSNSSLDAATDKTHSSTDDEANKIINDKTGNYEEELSQSGKDFSISLLKPFTAPKAELTESFITTRGNEKDEGSTVWWAKNIEDGEVASNGISYSMDWLMSILCAIVVFVGLLAICLEVVVRNLKLVFLEAMAPIPVISYMNPNDKLLANFIKQYIGTFLSLFMYIIAIQAITPLMMALLKSVNDENILLNIIIIGGSLVFMKQAPKFISNILGIENMAGSLGDSLKMVKTGLGVGVGAAAGATVGGLLGGGHALLSGGNVASGFVGGTFGGAMAGAKRKGFGKAINTQFDKNNKNVAATAAGATSGGMLLNRMLSPFGASPYQKDERKINQYDSLLNSRKAFDERIEGEMLKKDYGHMGSAKKDLDLIKTTGKDFAGNSYTSAQLQAKEKIYNDNLTAAKVNYIAGYDYGDGNKGIKDDVQAQALAANYDNMVEGYGLPGISQKILTSTTADEYKATKGKIEDAKVILSNSEGYAQHKANADASGHKK